MKKLYITLLIAILFIGFTVYRGLTESWIYLLFAIPACWGCYNLIDNIRWLNEVHKRAVSLEVEPGGITFEDK